MHDGLPSLQARVGSGWRPSTYRCFCGKRKCVDSYDKTPAALTFATGFFLPAFTSAFCTAFAAGFAAAADFACCFLAIDVSVDQRGNWQRLLTNGLSNGNRAGELASLVLELKQLELVGKQDEQLRLGTGGEQSGSHHFSAVRCVLQLQQSIAAGLLAAARRGVHIRKRLRLNQRSGDAPACRKLG